MRDEDGHPLPESPLAALRRERDDAVERLSLLLSAVSNEQGRACPRTGPCAVCSAAEEAQSFLNDLHPERVTGWWWTDEDADVVSKVDALAR